MIPFEDSPLGWAAKTITGLTVLGLLICLVGGSWMPAIPVAVTGWVIWHVAKAFDEG